MEYRLDKTSFKKQSLREADQNQLYWQDKNVEERLAAAWFLICQAYNIPYENPPRLEKHFFTCRHRTS